MSNEIAEQTMLAFFSSVRLLNQEARKKGHLLWFTLGQLDALKFIAEQGQVTMSQLADYLLVTPPSATTLVDHFAKKGLVKRMAKAKDRRSVSISLSKKGKERLQITSEVRCKTFNSLLKKLSVSEQRSLQKLLKKLTGI